jgi:hypothetical protein
MIYLYLLLYSIASFSGDYIIQKGDHYSTPRKIEIFRGKELKFKAQFVGQADYDFGDIDQYDVNKLYGTSDCGGTHQENSARFGWRWLNGKLEILAYTHINGGFDFKLIGEAKINQVINLGISISNDNSQYIFEMNGKTVTMARGCRESIMSGYKLFPYFGGNKSAPRDFHIQLEDHLKKANFSLESIYPNPTADQHINLKINLIEDLKIGFFVYDVQGRLVFQKGAEEYTASDEPIIIPLTFENLSHGLYLVQPYAIINGEIVPGFVSAMGNALKFISI